MIFEEIMGLAVSNGLFAVLFVFLLFYSLKDSKKREAKYQDTIEKLNKNLVCFKIKEKKNEEKDKAV